MAEDIPAPRLPEGVPADHAELPTPLPDPDNWPVKVHLANCHRYDRPELQVGDTDDHVGHVWVSTDDSPVMLPVAGADDDEDGTELLRHAKRRWDVDPRQNFFSIFPRLSPSFTRSEVQIPDALAAIKKWRAWGGANLEIRSYPGGPMSGPHYDLTFDQLIERDGDVRFGPDETPPPGDEFTRGAQAVADALAAADRGEGDAAKAADAYRGLMDSVGRYWTLKNAAQAGPALRPGHDHLADVAPETMLDEIRQRTFSPVVPGEYGSGGCVPRVLDAISQAETGRYSWPSDMQAMFGANVDQAKADLERAVEIAGEPSPTTAPGPR